MLKATSLHENCNTDNSLCTLLHKIYYLMEKLTKKLSKGVEFFSYFIIIFGCARFSAHVLYTYNMQRRIRQRKSKHYWADYWSSYCLMNSTMEHMNFFENSHSIAYSGSGISFTFEAFFGFYRNGMWNCKIWLKTTSLTIQNIAYDKPIYFRVLRNVNMLFAVFISLHIFNIKFSFIT